MKALLAEAQKQGQQQREVEGEWYKVTLTPELFSGDSFNVGVVFKQGDKLQSRFMAYFDRLRCLYGNEIEEHTRFLLQILRNQLDEEDFLNSPSNNIRFQGPFYTSGDSVEAILEELFNTCVPIGKAPESSIQKLESAFQAINNHKARGIVYEQLHHKIGLESNSIVPQGNFLEIITENTKRKLDVPLRPFQHYGSIVSACYKNKSTIANHIRAAHIELQTAQRLKPVNGKLGLFILRPNDSMRLTEKEADGIDEVLEETLWKIRANNYFIEANEDPKILADEVVTWAY